MSSRRFIPLSLFHPNPRLPLRFPRLAGARRHPCAPPPLPQRRTRNHVLLPARTLQQQLLFHTTRPYRWFRQDDAAPHRPHHQHGATHYDTLNVAPGTSPAEVKMAFYRLSKVHHPDHNPADQTATERFTRLSEAYSVLGSPAKRAAYDRSLGLHAHSPAGRDAPPRGSYHSTGRAGGRAASGLSRRRTPFRAPPPPHHNPHGQSHPNHQHQSVGGTMGGYGSGGGGGGGDGGTYYGGDGGTYYGGMGPGQNPFGRAGRTLHFDKEAHERTHRFQDERREQRRQREARMRWKEEQLYKPEVSSTMHFLIIGGIICMVVFGPVLVHYFWDPKGKKRRARELGG